MFNDFDDDLFDPTDDEIAEDLRNDGGPMFISCRRSAEDTPELRLAKQVLKSKGVVLFNRIGADKHGEIFEIVRRKGEAKPGIVRHDGKAWKFFPHMNFNFDAVELDEICAFLEEQL